MNYRFAIPAFLRSCGAALTVFAVMLTAQQQPKPQQPKPQQPKPVKQTTPPKPTPKKATDAVPPPVPVTPVQVSAPKVVEKSLTRLIATKQEKDKFEADPRVALLVAPSYKGSGLSHLRYTVADMLELKAELERQGYTVIEIGPAEATSDSVRQSLQNAKQMFENSRQGTFLFAFSGHGFQSASEEGKPGKNYLVTTGANERNLEQEALALDEVQLLMKASGARRRVILADACRNVPDAKSSDPKRTMTDFQAAEGTVVLLSTSPGGVSYEDEEIQHGIFSYYVLEALRGKAAKEGYITVFDLKTYLERMVVAHAIKKQKSQKPFFKTADDVSGDFLLGTAAPAKPEQIKPSPAAGVVDAETPVLFEIRTNNSTRKVYANIERNKLVLVDAQSYVPIAVLRAQADETNDKPKADGASKPQVFVGSTPDQNVYHVAVLYRGEEIDSVEGRVGQPCPGNKNCVTASQVPLLPGETRKGNKIQLANTLADFGAKLGRIWGDRKTQEVASKTEMTAAQTAMLEASLKDPLKFEWRAYQLTAKPRGLK